MCNADQYGSMCDQILSIDTNRLTGKQTLRDTTYSTAQTANAGGENEIVCELMGMLRGTLPENQRGAYTLKTGIPVEDGDSIG